MEDLPAPVASEESGPDMQMIEIYDIVLADGTHYRFCTASADTDLLDAEP